MTIPILRRSALPLLLLLFLRTLAPAQARDLPPAAAPLPNGQTQEQRGRELLDLMVKALGGDAWLNRKVMFVQGRTAAFFRGAPTGVTVEFVSWRRFPDATRPAGERVEFLTDRGMIKPGKKRDVAQVWTADSGTEITYKGKEPLPKDQVADYFRRQHHSIEEVVRTWLKQPGVMIVAEGTSMVERHLADQITILAADNDAVTIELDANSHLPLRRTFQYRNEQFKDHDEDREEYDDYHTFQGLPSPMTLTRYKNGDMSNQRFLSKVEYEPADLPADTFDPDAPLRKK